MFNNDDFRVRAMTTTIQNRKDLKVCGTKSGYRELAAHRTNSLRSEGLDPEASRADSEVELLETGQPAPFPPFPMGSGRIPRRQRPEGFRTF